MISRPVSLGLMRGDEFTPSLNLCRHRLSWKSKRYQKRCFFLNLLYIFSQHSHNFVDAVTNNHSALTQWPRPCTVRSPVNQSQFRQRPTSTADGRATGRATTFPSSSSSSPLYPLSYVWPPMMPHISSKDRGRERVGAWRAAREGSA